MLGKKIGRKLTQKEEKEGERGKKNQQFMYYTMHLLYYIVIH